MRHAAGTRTRSSAADVARRPGPQLTADGGYHSNTKLGDDKTRIDQDSQEGRARADVALACGDRPRNDRGRRSGGSTHAGQSASPRTAAISPSRSSPHGPYARRRDHQPAAEELKDRGPASSRPGTQERSVRLVA